MKKLPLTQGKFTLVDDADFDWLSQWKWHADETRYGGFMAARHRKGDQWKGRGKLRMHRVITDCPCGMQVDHKNHDTLDNRRDNLRICTGRQNQQNQQPQQGKTSQYKGVSFYKATKCWMAYIKHRKKKYHLGCFTNEIDAAKAYDEKAKEFFGEFACINFSMAFFLRGG